MCLVAALHGVVAARAQVCPCVSMCVSVWVGGGHTWWSLYTHRPNSVSRGLPSSSRTGYEDPVGMPVVSVASRYSLSVNFSCGAHK